MIRQKVSSILGARIEPGQWDRAFARFAIDGKFTQKTLQDIILELCKTIEVLEDKLSPENK